MFHRSYHFVQELNANRRCIKIKISLHFVILFL